MSNYYHLPRSEGYIYVPDIEEIRDPRVFPDREGLDTPFTMQLKMKNNKVYPVNGIKEDLLEIADTLKAMMKNVSEEAQDALFSALTLNEDGLYILFRDGEQVAIHGTRRAEKCITNLLLEATAIIDPTEETIND